jgi:hypothetical protein
LPLAFMPSGRAERAGLFSGRSGITASIAAARGGDTRPAGQRNCVVYGAFSEGKLTVIWKGSQAANKFRVRLLFRANHPVYRVLD